jgi:O-antigen/teichoic acid export membrane protein
MNYSIKKRFVASIIGNLLRSGISFVTGLLIARFLGPEDYGRMAFLLASFMAFKLLLDMASSHAFFTFLSQRKRSRRFIFYFWCWVGFQFLFSLLLVCLLLPDQFINLIWEGESRSLVILAFLAVFMQHIVWANASRMAEAQRETIRVQKLNTIVVFIHLIVVVSLVLLEQLAIPLLFVAIIFEWLLAGFVTARMYKGQSDEDVIEANNSLDTPLSVWNEFWFYCLPFIPYAWFSFIHDLADRWMLQHWGGPSEQAYYAVARQFSMVALLATSSILSILWKEVAEAYHQGDMTKVEFLYNKTIKGLYFIAAFVAGAFFPWSTEILSLVVGEAYIGGAVTLMIMIFYPMHQAIGQITGSTLLATEHSRLQVILGLIFMSLSLVVAYFVLAPKDAIFSGLGLASQGLAWKMLLMQIIQVNVWLWVISRIFKWKFDWSFQYIVLALVLLFGWLIKILIMKLYLPLILTIFISIGIYSILILFVLYHMPWIGGLSRDEWNKAINDVKFFLRNK